MKLKNKTEMIDWFIGNMTTPVTLTINNYTLVRGANGYEEKLVRTESTNTVIDEARVKFARLSNGSTLIYPNAKDIKFEENKIIWRRNATETIIEFD